MRTGTSVMGEIVNLNRFRKERAKAGATQKAAENRAAKGRSKVQKTRLQMELEKARREWETKRRDD